MPRTAIIAASLAAILAAAAPLAYGQSTVNPSPSTPPSASASSERSELVANYVMPGQLRSSELAGAAVYDRDNANLGTIKDVIIGKQGRVAAVILNIGATLGIGGRYVAVGFDDLKIASDDSSSRPHIAIDMTKAQLKSAQAFNLNERGSATGSSTPPPAERSD